MTRKMTRTAGIVLLSLGMLWSGLGSPVCGAAESWPEALGRMPLRTNITELNQTHGVDVMLRAFESNQTVKALIFMPGATDEFYMFHRVRASLAQPSPTLLDAVQALTNQTFIRVTFRPPMLLLHTDEDPLEPIAKIRYQRAADHLRKVRFVPHALYFDRDWNYLHPILSRTLKASFRPWPLSTESWHFYRHSFAAWNLTGWEALEAVALAGKTQFTVRHYWNLFVPERQVVFEGDRRVRALPPQEPAWQPSATR